MFVDEMYGVGIFDTVPNALGDLTKFIGSQGAPCGFIFVVVEQFSVVKLAT